MNFANKTCVSPVLFRMLLISDGVNVSGGAIVRVTVFAGRLPFSYSIACESPFLISSKTLTVFLLVALFIDVIPYLIGFVKRFRKKPEIGNDFGHFVRVSKGRALLSAKRYSSRQPSMPARSIAPTTR